ncbi:MAG: TetR/AcrR family transcriptional regulator [Chloroflexota bacterium]
MLNSPLDFKEQMAEARRTQILMGAAKVFAEKGYHKATTKEIALAAGVSEGTIYNYFDNKRELLVAMIELLALQSLRSIIANQPPVDPKEFITMGLRDRYQLAQERGHLILPILAEMFSDAELRQEVYRKLAMPVAGHLEQYIQTHINSGLFRPVNPMVVTRMFIGAIIINFAMKLANLDPRYEDISAEALIEELASLFMGMLLNPERAEEK